MNSNSNKVSLKEKIGYSMGVGGANLVFQMMMFLLFYSFNFVSATIATFIVQGLTLPLVYKFGQGNAQKGWSLTIGAS